jgi:hypothetical protein
MPFNNFAPLNIQCPRITTIANIFLFLTFDRFYEFILQPLMIYIFFTARQNFIDIDMY